MQKIDFNLDLDSIANFLSKLAEKSPHVYWLSSPDFKRIAYISLAYETIWGRSRESLYAQPETWITFLHPDDVNEGYHPIHRMAEKVASLGEKASFEENYRIVRPDGKVRWILDRGFPIYEDGKCCGVTGVAIDITKEKQTAEELREAKEQAEAANQLKAAFIRDMEHDIRTPFSGIYSIAQHLFKQETESTKKEFLECIVNAAKELLDYCNTILDFSRIESGVLPIIEKKFDLYKLLDSVIAIEKPAAHFKGLELLFDRSSKLPQIVLGDQYRLHRILINLLSNAIKFTKAGFVKLTVKLQNQEPKQAIISFMIEDTGIGIPENQQSIIFEKFARVTPANKNLYKGNGLGLKAVKQFISELEGDIELVSELDRGSAFILTIPFRLPLVSEIANFDVLHLK